MSVLKKKKEKRGNECMKRGHERERGSALDRGGPLESQKRILKKRGDTLPHVHTSRTKSTLKHTIACFLCASYMIPSFFFRLSVHSFHSSRQYKGASGPVPSRNPSLHLGVCVPVCFFYPKSLQHSHSPVFLNLTFCIFIPFRAH